MRGARGLRQRRRVTKPLDFNPHLISSGWDYPVRLANGGFKTGFALQGPFDGSAFANLAYYSTGGFIATYFRERFDMAQGSIVFRYTPEVSSGDGTERFFLNSSLTESHLLLQLIKTTDEKLSFRIAWGEQGSVDISNWIAGDTYLVIIRWDSKNPLDGMNHVCVSTNDIHSFSRASSWTPPIATPVDIAIGFLPPIPGPSDKKSMNGIISGLTIYRRPLFDGTYGVDVGNGDELAQIYNAGAGLDTCIVTKGSWDVCWCWPVQPGLTQSYSFSWAHPFTSNVIGDPFCQTTYSSSAYSTVGSPSSGPSDITGSQRIFWWGYEWTCAAANEGVKQGITGVSAGKKYIVRTLAHCTSANNIRVRLWDDTNGAQIGADFDFGASSSRTAPGVAILTFELPTVARNGVASDCTAWTINILGTANGQTVYLHQVEVLENLIDNPSLETGAGDPWIPDGWTNVGLDAGDTAQEGTTIHSGVAALKWNTGAAGPSDELLRLNVTGTEGDHLAVGGWLYDGGLSIGGRDVTHAVHQSDEDGFRFSSPDGAVWGLQSGVLVMTRDDPQMAQFPASFITWARYSDDVYAIALNSDTFGYTPDFSTFEGEFIRMDDGEYAEFDIPFFQFDERGGTVRWKWKQRHPPADVLKYGIPSPKVWTLYGNASNYVVLEWSAANTVRLRFNDGGGEHSGTWDATGAFAVLDELDGVLKVDKFGMTLTVNGLEQIVINEEVEFDVPLTLMYPGTDNDGTGQCDALYGLP